MEIDDSLYSRQRYVLGDSAMKQLAASDVLICGLGGVGVEIAKNIVLAGVKSLTIVDTTVSTMKDLGTQFYISVDDVRSGRTRAEASLPSLSELNPHVAVMNKDINIEDNIGFLTGFQCVVVTQHDLSAQVKINEFCRSQSPVIKFISADVVGLCGRLFCDFGNEFVVADSDGEEPKEMFIECVEPGTTTSVSCFEYRRHGLESGDYVRITEVNGMTELNGTAHCITVTAPDTFSIDVDSSGFSKYLHGGVAKQLKKENTIHFKSLHHQLSKPDILPIDFSQLDLPTTLHFALMAVDALNRDKHVDGINEFVALCKSLAMQNGVGSCVLNEDAIKLCYRTQPGRFAPLCAIIGGIAAQEVLKSVTGKFTPLMQWLYVDAFDVVGDTDDVAVLSTDDGRDFDMVTCLNERVLAALRNTKLFMVGCGAIGCEMLKNFALLSIGTGDEGMITVTDNDLIEKSNLNRQFLFRSRHIQKSKSLVAADVIKSINPDLAIRPLQHKVCVETEEEIFNDDLFQSQTIVVNALDNIQARRYVDSRCVSNKVPLLETGTMGPKGHVQVIYPHITESYGAQRDPIDDETPYCTLKSFPQVIEHTIQWARAKFENSFSHKPTSFNKFWKEHGPPSNLCQAMSQCYSEPEGFTLGVGMVKNAPCCWNDCVSIARMKFEKFFNHTAKQLIHIFPLDTILSDGSLFWQSPKRPPRPVCFEQSNELHMLFLMSYAKLVASVYRIKPREEDLQIQNITSLISAIQVPEWVPSNKVIETDESVKNDNKPKVSDSSKVEICREYLNSYADNMALPHGGTLELHPEVFEKDDDANSHIDFITATSNLRAEMYGIEKIDRFQTKRIAGKIIPAIATTTAAIAGLACIELVKMISQSKQKAFKNTFLNLALPLLVLSEPGPPAKVAIRGDLSYTIWDRWDVEGSPDYLLKNFISHFKERYDLTVSMVVHGVKMIFVPVIPGHLKRQNDRMVKLLKPGPKTKYLDLTVAFENPDDDDEDLSCPPVRYNFNM